MIAVALPLTDDKLHGRAGIVTSVKEEMTENTYYAAMLCADHLSDACVKTELVSGTRYPFTAFSIRA